MSAPLRDPLDEAVFRAAMQWWETENDASIDALFRAVTAVLAARPGCARCGARPGYACRCSSTTRNES